MLLFPRSCILQTGLETRVLGFPGFRIMLGLELAAPNCGDAYLGIGIL